MIRDFLRDIPPIIKIVLAILIAGVIALNYLCDELKTTYNNDFLTRRLVEAEKKALHGDTRLISKLNMEDLY